MIEVSQQDARDFVDGEVSALAIELVETGLIDESLVEVFNGLVEAGVVTPATRCLPSEYATYLQFGYADPDLYGFTFDCCGTTGATTTTTRTPGRRAGSRRSATATGRGAGSLAGQLIDPDVRVRLPMPEGAEIINALRLTGTLGLPGYGVFTDSPTLNGPKIIPVTPPTGAAEVEIGYTMGGGYSTFTCRAAA